MLWYDAAIFTEKAITLRQIRGVCSNFQLPMCSIDVALSKQVEHNNHA